MAAVLLGESLDYLGNNPAPAIYRRIKAEDRPFSFHEAGSTGTGGMASVVYLLNKQGYSAFEVVINYKNEQAQQTFATLMQVVKQGFDRTFRHLPAVFGVSRQTLYNWASGETPKEVHRPKVVQLAAAAEVFIAADFKPTGSALNRTVRDGKNFLDLIAVGADGAETARQLIRIHQRGLVAKARLDAVFGDRPVSNQADADF
jgi:hypothetical protein